MEAFSTEFAHQQFFSPITPVSNFGYQRRVPAVLNENARSSLQHQRFQVQCEQPSIPGWTLNLISFNRKRNWLAKFAPMSEIVLTEKELEQRTTPEGAGSGWLLAITRALLELQASFCSRCKGVPLENIFEGLWSGHFGLLEDLTTAIQATTTCDLCQVVNDAYKNKRSMLLKVPCDREHGQTTDLREFIIILDVCAAVTPAGLTTLWLTHGYSISRLMPWPPTSTSIRLDLFRKQIQRCEREHRQCAHPVPVDIPNLRVIDCSSRRIVAAPRDCVYLALSYVWGRIPRIPAIRDVLPASIHSTLKDALIVTQDLGYNYLWVDQYCIDQEAKDSIKAGQLAQMNSIYNNAQVTIIAASGADVTSGLPGVRFTPKSESFIRSREHITICTSINDLFTLTNKSVWMSRAWTMQEAMFAHRRLIFTEDQVFLQCRTQCYGEPQCLPHGVIQWPIFSGMPIPFAADLRDNVHGPYFFAIAQAITTYTRRHLTEAGDILHALRDF